MTEPVAISCLYVTEVDALMSDGHVRLIGVVEVPAMGGATAERRIVGRWVLAIATARDLQSALRKLLNGRAH